MGKSTKIAWTDHTFNPVWGCTKASAGCAHCYAATMAKRWGHRVWGRRSKRRTLSEGYWAEPLAWEKAAAQAGRRERVFCGSMCDVFEDHPTVAQERAKLWPLIQRTPHLDWLLLTKRAESIAGCLPADWDKGYPNVWLGVTIESIGYTSRADVLRAIPASVRFVSYEPALGPLDGLDLTGIDWVIYGGESGPKYRPDVLDWARAMKQRCEQEGISFFFKQAAGRIPGTLTTLDGQTLHGYPTPS